jgi:hypothetical protein
VRLFLSTSFINNAQALSSDADLTIRRSD